MLHKTLASRKPTPNIYTFCGQQLKSVQSHCYLGVQISNTLNWTAQCNSVARKAQQTLGVIRRNLNQCPTHIKSIAYTTLVRPILEYASASWDPTATRNSNPTFKDLQWDTLQTRRKIKRLSIIYKMEHNLIDIPLDHYIQHNTRTSRKHDSQFLQIRYSANIFGSSFFPTTIKEWNSLPSNTVSSKSLKSFQNSLIQHFNN
ncbi:hypothetical protein NP493_241g05026 [Ridgeia piscesae]|uniref:Uncharacterized protein n=1 Tax=Ridgeia piscesae TaxID=27915 RepID=A0AAD9NZA6_RIDPI|nr:hypothetical protein NP493_241g05026 [Ridgeia piscesae]